MRTFPRPQCALLRAFFAAVSARPNTFGTVQGIAPVVELVVNVSVAWPDPTVTVAEPADGVFAVMTLSVPGPPEVGAIAIAVTA